MPVFLVSGATGQQGSATVDALFKAKLQNSEIQVRGLTRDPSSASARSLLDRGAQPVKANLLDRESLLAALKGVDVAHLVTDFRGPNGVEGEIEQGKNFVDCAKDNGVSHIVFSSVAGADDASEVPHFNSKLVIENYIIASKITYTFVRPTSFMENIPPPGIGRFMVLGVMKAIFDKNKIYHIAAEDIGKTIAQAMLKPQDNKNKVINLVGEIADPDEMRSSLDRAEGYQHWRVWVPRWLVMAILPKEFYHMFSWLSRTYSTNSMPGTVQELKSQVPNVLTIESWARKQKEMREQKSEKKTS